MRNTFLLRMSLRSPPRDVTPGIGGRARVELRAIRELLEMHRIAHVGNAHAMPSVAVLLQRRMPG